MCYLIYISIIVLAWLYSDSILDQYALSVLSGENQVFTVALGWEIVLALWPVFLLVMVLASLVTLFVSRKIFGNGKPS